MNGKDGSIETFASLSGVSAPDLNDTIGTGIRYGRQGGVCCVISFEEHTEMGSPSTKAPRLQQSSNEQGKGGRNSICVFTDSFSIDCIFFYAKTKKEDTKHSSPGDWGKQYD